MEPAREMIGKLPNYTVCILFDTLCNATDGDPELNKKICEMAKGISDNRVYREELGIGDYPTKEGWEKKVLYAVYDLVNRAIIPSEKIPGELRKVFSFK